MWMQSFSDKLCFQNHLRSTLIVFHLVRLTFVRRHQELALTSSEPMSHTPLPFSIQQSSAIGPWPDLWIEYRYKVIQSAQNSPVHRQHSHSPPLPALILKRGPWRPLTPWSRMPLSPFSCTGETAVWAKLRLRPGYNRFIVQITCNLHQQKPLYCLF